MMYKLQYIVLILKWNYSSGTIADNESIWNWAGSRQNQQNGQCAQRTLKSAWASELYMGSLLLIERTAKTLIRLGKCPGWSGFSLGAQVILLVLSCSGSIIDNDASPCRSCCTFVWNISWWKCMSCCICLFPANSGRLCLLNNQTFEISPAIRVSVSKWAASWQNQQSGYAPSEDSDQPGHPPRLIRVFDVRMKKAWVLNYPLSAQRRLIRQGGCPGWSESSQGAHVILLVLSWGGSNKAIAL